MTEQIVSSLYYLPLIRQRERFIEPSTSLLGGADRIRVPDLQDYLARNYRLTRAEVELRSGTYISDIYVPREDQDDFAYVVADHNGVPPGETPPPPYSDAYRTYLQALVRHVINTEAIVPEQCSYLSTEFIRPSLSVLQFGHAYGTTRSWESIPNLSRFVVLGPAGSGKTSLLRRLVLELAEPRLTADRTVADVIPVYVSLRFWERADDLLGLVRRAMRTVNGETVAADFDVRAQYGGLWLMFDGLDEVTSDQRERVTDQISELSRRFPRLRLAISCRPASYHGEFSDFTHLQVNPWSSQQMHELITKKLYKRRSGSSLLLALEGMPDVFELARNPLILSLIIALYAKHTVHERDRARIMAYSVDALVEAWDAVRGIRRDTDELVPHEKHNALSRIAFECLRVGRSSFDVSDVSSWLPRSRHSIHANADLQRLHEQTSLIEHSDDGGWRMGTASVRTYLAAEFLVRRTEGVGDEAVLLLRHQEWQNLWADACAITPDASHLIRIALRAKTIEDVDKAIIVAQAFGQSITADEPTFNDSAGVLAREIRRFFENAVVHMRDETAELASITFEFGGQVSVPSDRQLRLLRLLYHARRSEIMGAVRSLLEIAGNATCEWLNLLRLDGNYEQNVRVSPAGCFLTLQVRRGDERFAVEPRDQT